MINRPLTWLRSKAPVRLPGKTVRLRLTLIYGGLFLVSGAALLAVTYVLFERATRTRNAAKMIPEGQPVGHTIPTLPPSTPVPKVVSIGPKALGEQIKRSSDLHQLLVNSAIALVIVAVVALVLGWFVAGRMLRPLRTMTATARRISASNLHERLDLRGPNDELKELGDTFDELLGRFQRSWDSQRQFVANVSHELRSPLTRLRLQADIAATDPDATVESLQAGYQAVIALTQQQEELIGALLSLAKGQRGPDHEGIVDLASIAVDILHARRQQAERRGYTSRPTFRQQPPRATPGSSNNSSRTSSTTRCFTTPAEEKSMSRPHPTQRKRSCLCPMTDRRSPRPNWNTSSSPSSASNQDDATTRRATVSVSPSSTP